MVPNAQVRLRDREIFYTLPHVPRFSGYVAGAMLDLAVNSEQNGNGIVVYDPFVGNGIILTIAQSWYSDRVKGLVGIDTDSDAVETARKNIRLLTDRDALQQRLDELGSSGDTRYSGAPEEKFIRRVESIHPVPVDIHQGNALKEYFSPSFGDRVVVTDPPYGNGCRWTNKQGDVSQRCCLDEFLYNMRENGMQKLVIAYSERKHVGSIVRKHFKIKEIRRLEGRKIYVAAAR